MPAEILLQHKDGEVAGMVIAERLKLPLETLKDVAIQNARSTATDVEVREEAAKTVNDNDVIAVVMDATVEGIDLTYYAYYYSGPEGSIQVVTWTGQNLFDELKPLMEDFLNGFITVKKDE